MHQSPIQEFSLSVDPDVTCVNIDQIILLLSRNLALNQLRLDCGYRIPLSIFNGFGNLTSLYLYNCNLYFESTFNGFGRLTSLYLDEVICPLETLLLLVSNCPLLKSFTLITEYSNVFGLDNHTAFVELFDWLPVIENLTLSAWFLWALVVDTSGGYFPISFVYLKQHLCLNRLKYLCLEYVSFIYGKGLPSFFLEHYFGTLLGYLAGASN